MIKTFKAVRFGVQRNSTGGPFVVGIKNGAYNLSKSNYMAKLGGSFHIDGATKNDASYIHAGNFQDISSNSYIKCVGISGPGVWTSFNKTMTDLGFNTVGATVIFEDAVAPQLIDSGYRWNP